jgi:hypothetical protein
VKVVPSERENYKDKAIKEADYGKVMGNPIRKDAQAL